MKSRSIILTILVILAVIFCGLSCQSSRHTGNNIDEPYSRSNLVCIAFIDARAVDTVEDLMRISKDVRIACERSGIRIYGESAAGATFFSVKKSDVAAAVNAIASAPELKDCTVIRSEFVPLIHRR